MPDILAQIIGDKKKEVAAGRRRINLTAMQNRAAAAEKPRPFLHSLVAAKNKNGVAIIAEIKQRSPSGGLLRADFNPAKLAKNYRQNGAACLSVLTDAPYFGGDATHLQAAKDACPSPLLRKDFIVDDWQVYESRAMGADAILLIAAVLNEKQIKRFSDIAAELEMAVLIESHDADDIKKSLTVKSAVIGINNRNLKTLAVTLQTTRDLLPLIRKNRRKNQPPHFVLSESGIAKSEDIAELTAAGVDGFLIGESLMRDNNPGAALKKLLQPLSRRIMEF